MTDRASIHRHAAVRAAVLVFIGLGVLSGPARAAPASQASGTPATQPARQDPTSAYAAGLEFGRRLRARLEEQGIKRTDGDLVVRGVIDGLNGLPPLWPEEQVDQAIAAIESDIARRRAEQAYAADPGFREMADENLKRGRRFLKENEASVGVRVLPGGIQLQTLMDGHGRVVGNADQITANFTVSLADGTLVRASEPGHPLTIPTWRLLPAVREAIHGMPVGAKWRLLIPAERAFGLAGKPPVIGPNQALAFELELVSAE
jgi:FKBP-type peptidyl-prolyl cis-trans isomerase FklB